METLILNMRWAGYLLVALGLINWRYQNNFADGAPFWIFGLALIAGTFIPAINKILITKIGAILVFTVVVILVVLAFIS